MSNVGQAALTIVGTVVGAYAGYPQLGFVLGSIAGQAFFPTKLPGNSGPRLNDARTTTATVGAAVMEVLGTDSVPGNINWMGPLKEVATTEEVGGKGGPTQENTSFSYFQSIAVGICRGTMAAVLRIWENGKLVYDARPQLTDESDATYAARVDAANTYAEGFTFYPGDEEQMPDPTIEADKGVGQVPAWRGLCYIVFANRRLQEEQGLRHPTYKFEVSASVVTGLEYSQEVVFPWLNVDADPRNPDSDYEYSGLTGSGFGIDTLDALQIAMSAGNDRVWRSLLDWQRLDEPYPHAVGQGESGASYQASTIYLLYFREENDALVTIAQQDALIGNLETTSVAQGPPGHTTYSAAYGLSYTTDTPGADPSPPGGYPDDGWTAATHYPTGYWFEYDSNAHYIQATRLPSKPAGTGWTPATGTFHILQAYGRGSRGPDIDFLPLNPTIKDDDPRYNDEAFWTAAYDAAVLAGDMDPGYTYGMQYPHETTSNIWMRPQSAVGEPIALSAVIEAICGRVSVAPSDIDVSDLTDILIGGYTITRVMSARDALEPLRNVGYFDVVESGALMRFVKRGKAIARTIGEGDFAREGGTDPGPNVTTKDALESDLPRRVRVHYKAPSRDYEDGEQISPGRSTVKAVNDLDLEIAVSISDDMAAQIAEVIWADAWEGRRSHEFTLDADACDIEGGDLLALPVDGFLQRVRINAIDETIGSLRKFEALRDYDGSYASAAVADVPERHPGAIVVLAPSEILFLDLPPLRDTDNDPGIYATTRPVTNGATWRGASILKSTDDGATFVNVAGVSNEPATGTIVAAIPAGDSLGFDTRYTIDVEIHTGSLESRTDAALFTGANTAAIGADGRWELVQFSTVTQLSTTRFRLSRLIRGRRGTEWAMGLMANGDTFVLVSGPGIIRLPVTVPEIGLDIVWKAVTFGMAQNTGIDATFASAGEALRPFSPVNVASSINEAGDLVLAWVRRGRIGHEFTSGIEVPLSEATEAYEIDIVAGSEVVRTLTSTTQTVTYTVALQVEDFGPDLTAIDACVYQMSAVVGRGHPGCLSESVDANEVEGSLEALPFVPAYDDQPLLIGTTADGFIFTRRGRKGEKIAVGFYYWPAGGSPPGSIDQFDDNYDGEGAEFWPNSYFAGAAVNNNQDGAAIPARGFSDALSEWSIYWRVNAAGGTGSSGSGGTAQKWLISGDDDTTMKIVSRAATPLPSTTRGIVGLMPKAGSVIYAIAAEVSISPTARPDIYKSTDAGATWSFIATTTGDLPVTDSLAPIRIFEHQGKTIAFNIFGNFVNAANDLIDWDDQGGTPSTALDAMRDTDPIASITDFDYTATEILAIGFSASSFTSGGGYVGQTNRIIRSTDGGATWSVVREVLVSSDIAPGFSYPIDWKLIRKFGAGYIVYGKALTAFAFPWALISTDAGATWATAQAVDTGDVTGNAVIMQALSDGATILAIDTFGTRRFNGSAEFGAGADPIVYGRLSYSTDGLTFSALPGFPTA